MCPIQRSSTLLLIASLVTSLHQDIFKKLHLMRWKAGEGEADTIPLILNTLHCVCKLSRYPTMESTSYGVSGGLPWAIDMIRLVGNFYSSPYYLQPDLRRKGDSNNSQDGINRDRRMN